METLSRRRFLQAGGATLGALWTMPMWLRLGTAGTADAAVTASGPRLLVMFWQGGNDGLNTLIPYTSSAYYAGRPNIAYQPDKVLKLSDSTDVGLQPNLVNVQKYYEARKVAIVQGVGYDHPDLSHFASTDIWETASPTHAKASGWLGRYLDLTPDNGAAVRAVSIGNALPPAIVGDSKSGVAIPSFGGFVFYDGSDTDTASEPYKVHQAFLGCADVDLPGVPAQALVASDRQTVAAVRAINSLGDSKAPAPATLADQVDMAVKLLSSPIGVQIAFVTIGGFDDHAAEQNNHPTLLGQVDAAVARFHDSVAKLPNPGDYLLVTFSEFGRRVEESGSLGTDHGTAAPLFVVGESVAGGLYGAQPKLDKSALDDNGNLVRAVDFREVYSTIIDRFLGGVSSTDVLGVTASDGLHPVPFLR